MLIVERSVRIDVDIKETEFLLTENDRYGHRQARPPRAIVPRQIDSLHVAQRHPAQKRDTHVAFIIDRNLLFKVQPPLALLWLYSPRQSGADVSVGDA